MAVTIKGRRYYRSAEACEMAGISKNTFLRWVRSGVLADVELRDRRGWRLFTRDDIKRLSKEAGKTV